MSEDAGRDVAADVEDPNSEQKVLAQMQECDTGTFEWKLNGKFLMVAKKGRGTYYHVPVEEFGRMLGAFGVVVRRRR
jgi:hypothetical protein